MVDPSPHSELDKLLAVVVSGVATPEELARLESLLDGNRQAQQRYIHYLDLHAELLRRGEFHAGLDQPAEPRQAWRKWTWLAVGLAAAILMALGISIGRVWQGGAAPQLATPEGVSADEPTDDGVAVLALAADVQWLSENPPHSGSILSPGTLKLESGLAQIEFYSGARLIVEGPAELEIVSANQAICRSGKLRAVVPPPARGFSILSPQFELVDLGTEFGLEVAAAGTSKVQVFDGEVELYPPDGKRAKDAVERLLEGAGLSWDVSGKRLAVQATPAEFPSFEAIRSLKQSSAQKRLGQWKKWSAGLANDPRVAFHFDFESEGVRLLDRGPSMSHGAIVGPEWVSGRWPEKRALEFKRPGDRIRLNLPGVYDSLTLTAWLRVDALTDRPQGLLLTDGYEFGRPHWQISPAGSLRLGLRVPSEKGIGAMGYGSPALFSPRRLGVWCFVASVCDHQARQVHHYFNSRLASSHELVGDQPLQLGLSEIGNWGVPFHPNGQVIRNFVGRIDELTIWRAALSTEEIREIYAKTRP